MTTWREVQEALYARWAALWVDGAVARTPTLFDNEAGFDPPEGPWAKVEAHGRPGGNGTLGSPGNRKMDRRGVVFIRLREPPGDGVGRLSDLAQHARDVFENCRVPVHGIRFNNVDIGEAALVDSGRWWGVTIEAPFDFEETK